MEAVQVVNTLVNSHCEKPRITRNRLMLLTHILQPIDHTQVPFGTARLSQQPHLRLLPNFRALLTSPYAIAWCLYNTLRSFICHI